MRDAWFIDGVVVSGYYWPIDCQPHLAEDWVLYLEINSPKEGVKPGHALVFGGGLAPITCEAVVELTKMPVSEFNEMYKVRPAPRRFVDPLYIRRVDDVGCPAVSQAVWITEDDMIFGELCSALEPSVSCTQQGQ